MVKAMADNVSNFIDVCSNEIGKHCNMDWNIELFNDCLDLDIESPIEQILYCALKTIRKLNYIPLDEPHIKDRNNYITGLGFYPQRKIGNYRVDFLVGNYTWDRKNNIQKEKEVIIECDSQQFHERTEQERRYEKQRDRFLQSKGFKIFHYTGAEICQKPLEIAQEIISFIMDIKKEDIFINANFD